MVRKVRTLVNLYKNNQIYQDMSPFLLKFVSHQKKFKMSPAAKYAIRAIKYFFYFTFLLALFLTVLVLAGVVEGNIETMFRGGYRSLLSIALMFICVSSVYPIFGFVRKSAIVPGEYKDIRDGIVDAMESRGYVLEKEEGENLSFRLKSTLNKITRMYEDRITFTRELGGFSVEGLRKDAIRIIYGIESRFRKDEE